MVLILKNPRRTPVFVTSSFNISAASVPPLNNLGDKNEPTDYQLLEAQTH